MFVTGSSTRGTTTTGADISTVIPTKDYAAVISKKIGKPAFTPKKTLPMFLVDSEGMNLRGDAFDFATTSPPAVVAKMIIWVGEGTLQTAGKLMHKPRYAVGAQLHTSSSQVSCMTLGNTWTAWIRSLWVAKLVEQLVTQRSQRLDTLQSS